MDLEPKPNDFRLIDLAAERQNRQPEKIIQPDGNWCPAVKPVIPRIEPNTRFSIINLVLDNAKREWQYYPSFRKGWLITAAIVVALAEVCSILPPES